MFASKDLFFSKPSGYQISRSVRLRSSASAYLNRTFVGTPTTFTVSFWVKRGTLGTGQRIFGVRAAGSIANSISFTSSDILELYSFQQGLTLNTTAVFRDPAAWYHFVISTTTGNTTVYCNNTQVATSATAFRLFNSAAGGNAIGRDGDNAGAYFDGYLTEINFIDGQALTPSSFGETNALTGVWQPKKYTGTYGTNGFYLNFSDNSGATATTIGKDYSGNGNNWTPNNISVTAGVTYDSMLDVPTLWADGGNGRGNYCVINPFDKWNQSGTIATLSEANLRAAYTTGTTAGCLATFPVNQDGKWYWEVTLSSANATLGVAPSGFVTSSRLGVEVYSNGLILNDGTSVQSGLASWSANDVIAFSYDASTRSLQAYRNNATHGTAVTISTTANAFNLFPLFGDLSSVLHFNAYANFGQRPFSYTPPTGFVALNTQNLPTPTIANGALYMAAKTFTGNASTQSISNAVNGVSFQPDLVWLKSRSNANNHTIYDVLRGVDNILYPNLTNAAVAGSGNLTAFNSNGFTLGASENSNDNSGESSVGWQWKAGGTSSSNTNGSITSTVSANPTAGFSVVTYTGNGTGGATVGHGLGVAPRMVIVKPRIIVDNWNVYHASNGASPATQVLYLNLTNATSTNSTIWNNTAPTSSVFSIGTNSGINTNGSTYVAYCFAEVAGFSKFGKYTGNGSADGPFVFLGFRPRWIMVKSSTTAQDWKLIDTARNTYNSSNSLLGANISSAEDTNAAYDFDILSNGFKPRNTFGYANTSGATYIFAAFAENPTKFSLAR